MGSMDDGHLDQVRIDVRRLCLKRVITVTSTSPTELASCGPRWRSPSPGYPTFA